MAGVCVFAVYWSNSNVSSPKQDSFGIRGQPLHNSESHSKHPFYNYWYCCYYNQSTNRSTMRSNTFSFILFILVTLLSLGASQEATSENSTTTVHTTTIPASQFYPSFVQRVKRYLGYERVMYHDGLCGDE
jgi:hypothetical protein